MKTAQQNARHRPVTEPVDVCAELTVLVVATVRFDCYCAASAAVAPAPLFRAAAAETCHSTDAH